MAKKGPRGILALVCTTCKRQNFISEKNKTNKPDKLVLNKYCPKCRKYTSHKETSKLK